MCRDVLTVTGQPDEVYQCQRRKRRHRKHRARIHGADYTGSFVAKVTWRRP